MLVVFVVETQRGPAPYTRRRAMQVQTLELAASQSAPAQAARLAWARRPRRGQSTGGRTGNIAGMLGLRLPVDVPAALCECRCQSLDSRAGTPAWDWRATGPKTGGHLPQNWTRTSLLFHPADAVVRILLWTFAVWEVVVRIWVALLELTACRRSWNFEPTYLVKLRFLVSELGGFVRGLASVSSAVVVPCSVGVFLVLKVVCVLSRGTCRVFLGVKRAYCVLCLTMHFLGVSLMFWMSSEKRLQYWQVLLPLVSRQVIFSTVLSGCSGHFAFRVSHYLSTCRVQGLWSTCGSIFIECRYGVQRCSRKSWPMRWACGQLIIRCQRSVLQGPVVARCSR